MITRQEHIAWSKKRALVYVDKGDLVSAITSMMSDLDQHPETKAAGQSMGALGIWEAVRGNADSVRRFIEGFRS